MSDRLLCIIAHPDDETLFAGGMMGWLSQKGVEIHILSATRGEGGELGDPPVTTREGLGRVREQELRCAARELGASSVRFLDYVDPPVGENDSLYPYTTDIDGLALQFAKAIETIEPTLILTHGSGGEYGHPAHVITHLAVMQAHSRVLAETLTPHLYTFSAAVPGIQDRVLNLEDPADIVIDVTQWLSVKAAAADCHRTQHSLLLRRHPDVEPVLDVMRRLESLHRVWPPDGPDLPILEPPPQQNNTRGARQV